LPAASVHYFNERRAVAMIPSLLFPTVAAFLLVFCSLASSQSDLGPKDGRDLPPTDLDRIKAGTPAPDFTLESKDGERITLSDYPGRKNVVLVFYRGHW
jgi:cytochrome oxidase Cu insertion factor (SCO1/SenC/PrrC family)